MTREEMLAAMGLSDGPVGLLNAPQSALGGMMGLAGQAPPMPPQGSRPAPMPMMTHPLGGMPAQMPSMQMPPGMAPAPMPQYGAPLDWREYVRRRGGY